MLSKIAIVSSLILSHAFSAEFEYPEEHWDAESVMGPGVPNYCGSTHEHQSPINIITNSVQSCPTSNKLDWDLNTDIKTFKVENTGHNLRIVPIYGDVDSDDSGEDDSSEDDEFENEDTQGLFGKLKNNFGFNGQHSEYYLDSLHLHWGQKEGTGSEHRVDGTQSSMEVHFVHYSKQYKSAGVARDSSQENKEDPYTLAVVGVLFEIGEPNEFISKIIEQISKLATPDHEVEISEVSMSQVVPMNDDEVKGDYYHYKGSLTTPPCTPAGMFVLSSCSNTITLQFVF